MSVERLKQALKEEKIVLGEKETVRNLKFGKASTVFLASDCKPAVRENILSYQKQAKVNVFELEIKSEEVGTICKKQYPVSVLSY